MKHERRIFRPFSLLLCAALVLPAAYAYSQQAAPPNNAASGSTSLIVLSALSSPANDPVAGELASSITKTIDLTMQLTGRLQVQRADFLAPTTAFTRSLLYYEQVHANGAVFGSVKRAAGGSYVVELDVWNAAHPQAIPAATERTVTNLLSSFELADELSVQVASKIIGRKLAEGTLVVLHTASLPHYAVYANGHLLGRDRSSFRILTGKWTVIVARPGTLGDIPVQSFQVTIRKNRTETVALARKENRTTVAGNAPASPSRQAGSAASTRGTATGSIVLTTASAGVFSIDGIRESHLTAGSTRMLTYLEAGPHSIGMDFDNGSTGEKKVLVAGGRSTAVSFASQGGAPARARPIRPGTSVLLKTLSPGVFYLDGMRQAHLTAGSKTPLTFLTVGPHNIRMEFDNGSSQARRVVVSTSQRAPTLVTFSASGASGSIKVATRHSGLLYVPGSRPILLYSGSTTTLVSPPTGRFDVRMKFNDGSSRSVPVYYPGATGPELRLTFESTAGSRTRGTGSVGLSTGLSGVFFLDGVQESHVNPGSSVTLRNLSPGAHRLRMLFDNGASQETTVYVPAAGGVAVSVFFAPGGAPAARR